MDEFGYLSVLLSIILGLSVTQLLQGLSGIIQNRSRVRVYGPAVTWTVLLLLIDAQAWWAMFGLRNHLHWTFLDFVVVLLETTFLYLLAALVLPRFDTDGPIDLRENYFGHARWFFGSFIAVLIASLLKDLVLGHRLPTGLNLAFHIIGICGSLIAALTTSDRFHRAYSIFVGVMFISYIAVLFVELDKI
jgi:hypothetical protein